jgi:hypothetical protein
VEASYRLSGGGGDRIRLPGFGLASPMPLRPTLRWTMIPKGGTRFSDEIIVYLIVLAAFVRRKVIPPCCKML